MGRGCGRAMGMGVWGFCGADTMAMVGRGGFFNGVGRDGFWEDTTVSTSTDLSVSGRSCGAIITKTSIEDGALCTMAHENLTQTLRNTPSVYLPAFSPEPALRLQAVVDSLGPGKLP